jgi:hypothetical protein
MTVAALIATSILDDREVDGKVSHAYSVPTRKSNLSEIIDQ